MEKQAFIKSCRRKGYKYIQIAKFLGVSRQRVEQILRPDKHQARSEVFKALQIGSLIKKICEYPNCIESETEAHHFDYSKPLEVNWLCIKHHNDFHRKSKVKEKKVKLCGCGIETNRHSIRCKNCARKRRLKLHNLGYKNNPKRREMQKRATINWKKNNPEKWKKIIAKANKKYNIKNKDKISAKNKERHKLKKILSLN